MIRAAVRAPGLALALTLPLVACSPTGNAAGERAGTTSGTVTTNTGTTNTATPATPPAPEGVRRIATINGQPALASSEARPATLSITDGSAGVFSGCNGGGGTAVVAGGRLYLYGIMATQMACTRLMEQEEALFGIVTSAPRLTFAADGSGKLESERGTMTLAPHPQPVATDPTDPGFDHRPLLAGSRWNILSIDRQPTARTQRSAMTLSFGAQRWTIAPLDCPTVGGSWTQGDGTVRLTVDAAARVPACAAGAVTALTTAPLSYRIGPNDEWIAGNGHHGTAGGRDRFGEADAAQRAMTGTWRLTAIDGKPVVGAPERTLTFDGGGYYLNDGCARREGIYLTRGAALFLRGSNMVTTARCPPEPVASAFRDAVVNDARIAFDDPDRMTLVRRDGAITLSRVAPVTRAGGGTTTRLSPGMRIRLDGDRGTLHLVDARRFTLTLPCGTIAGDWNNRREPAQFSLNPPPDTCPATVDIRRLNNTLSGPVLARIGPNRDIILLLNDYGVLGGTILR